MDNIIEFDNIKFIYNDCDKEYINITIDNFKNKYNEILKLLKDRILSFEETVKIYGEVIDKIEIREKNI